MGVCGGGVDLRRAGPGGLLGDRLGLGGGGEFLPGVGEEGHGGQQPDGDDGGEQGEGAIVAAKGAGHAAAGHRARYRSRGELAVAASARLPGIPGMAVRPESRTSQLTWTLTWAG